MSRDEMQAQVAVLLAERAALSRFGIGLSPDRKLLLDRLLQRLGWTTAMATQFSRRRQRLVHLARRIHDRIKYAGEEAPQPQPEQPHDPFLPWKSATPQA